MQISARGPFQGELLEPKECLERIGAASLARVLISVKCLPAAVPVYVQVTKQNVLIASREPSVIEAARRGDVLAVQVDGTDPDATTWSVQATGVAHLPATVDTLRTESENSDLRRALDGGATLIAVAATVIGGERVRWSFPRPSL